MSIIFFNKIFKTTAIGTKQHLSTYIMSVFRNIKKIIHTHPQSPIIKGYFWQISPNQKTIISTSFIDSNFLCLLKNIDITTLSSILCVKQNLYLGDNCIQNSHLGRYIVGYTVGNLVLRRRVNGAIKRDFRTYILRNTFPNENFKYSYPHSNSQVTFLLKKD